MYDPKLNSYIVSHILSTSHVHIMSQDTCFCIEETWKIRFSRAFKKNTNFAFCFGGTFSFVLAQNFGLAQRGESFALPVLVHSLTFTWPFLQSPCLARALPCLSWPCLALPILALALRALALSCLALYCLALALSCLALP